MQEEKGTEDEISWMASQLDEFEHKLSELVMDRKLWFAAVHSLKESDMIERLE